MSVKSRDPLDWPVSGAICGCTLGLTGCQGGPPTPLGGAAQAAVTVPPPQMTAATKAATATVVTACLTAATPCGCLTLTGASPPAVPPHTGAPPLHCWSISHCVVSPTSAVSPRHCSRSHHRCLPPPSLPPSIAESLNAVASPRRHCLPKPPLPPPTADAAPTASIAALAAMAAATEAAVGGTVTTVCNRRDEERMCDRRTDEKEGAGEKTEHLKPWEESISGSWYGGGAEWAAPELHGEG